MQTRPKPAPPDRSDEESRFKYVSVAEGERILDRQAQKYLGMSGAEFARRYRAGTIEEPDRSEVIRVAMLLPLAER
ncbi:MAG TPA: hypothetical protein VFQ80_12610 [Thermomicrobiales bacterium]|jgi:hypothetical protein|nr:hypothetical protein [Thermomicrobiales bacterium]